MAPNKKTEAYFPQNKNENYNRRILKKIEMRGWGVGGDNFLMFSSAKILSRTFLYSYKYTLQGEHLTHMFKLLTTEGSW